MALEQLASSEALGDRAVLLDVLGMRGDQAKILLARHERLVLPAALLRDGDLQRALEEAMRLAEDISLRLIFAVRSSVEEAMAPGDRKPDPAEAKRFAESLAPERIYWAELARDFEMFLDELSTRDAHAVVNFEDGIRAAAELALHRTLQAIGSTARQLQGGARAERQLRLAFSELLPRRKGLAKEATS